MPQTIDIDNFMEAIIAPVCVEDLCAEVMRLGLTHCLVSRGDFDVFVARAIEIPQLLKEIGRLREMTFRSVGEGTGKALDIDTYDAHYQNLFIWDRKEKRVVGGYRMGFGAAIIGKINYDQLYINSLFEIGAEIRPILEKSIELGRSYIIPDYQKGYLPFFLLWQGILQVLLRNPSYQYLVGPVSISKYYSVVCKSLIVAFVKRYFFDVTLAKYFIPRTPFLPAIEDLDLDIMLDEIVGGELKDLESFLSTIEPAHIKVPVLLKQYTKLNARFISFNLDPNFSDALDGLMLLDIKDLPDSILKLLNEK